MGFAARASEKPTNQPLLAQCDSGASGLYRLYGRDHGTKSLPEHSEVIFGVAARAMR
jgi:hypothetical protein